MTTKNIPWKVTLKGRHLDSGSMKAGSAREVLDAVLAREVGEFLIKPEESYTIQAGDLLASSYGDEFEALRGASYLDETKLEPSGHLFGPAIAACPGGGEHDMNGDHLDPLTGDLYPKCRKCGLTGEEPCRRALSPEELQSQADALGGDPVSWDNPSADPLGDVQRAIADMDPDRVREDREIARAIEKASADGDLDPAAARDLLKAIAQGVARKVVRKLAEDAMRKAISGTFNIDPTKHLGPRCATPADHRLYRGRNEAMSAEEFGCLKCGKRYLMPDSAIISGGFDLETAAREALSA